eukprot:11179223-Lingulodinium_polyedra.AAC.1
MSPTERFAPPGGPGFPRRTRPAARLRQQPLGRPRSCYAKFFRDWTVVPPEPEPLEAPLAWAHCLRRR